MNLDSLLWILLSESSTTVFLKAILFTFHEQGNNVFERAELHNKAKATFNLELWDSMKLIATK